MNYFARDGNFYMTSYGKAQKVVNIRRNPKVALMVEAGDEYAGCGRAHQRALRDLEDEGSVREAFGRGQERANASPVQPGALASAQARGAQDRSGQGGQLGPPQARRAILTSGRKRQQPWRSR
jgi:hypothetical protein